MAGAAQEDRSGRVGRIATARARADLVDMPAVKLGRPERPRLQESPAAVLALAVLPRPDRQDTISAPHLTRPREPRLDAPEGFGLREGEPHG